MDVDTHGPIFNGEAVRLLDVMSADIEHEVGRIGADMVLDRLTPDLKHPTGYYESHIRAEPDGSDIKITDGGVVYGPWLEGTGSRNRTTRFKGYAAFRRTAQALDNRAEGIAETVAAPYVRRMG